MRRDVLGLLDEKTVSGLLGDKAKGHLRWMLGQLYSPVAGVTGDEWRADPWLLLRSVMMSQGRGMPTLDDGWITAKDSEGRSWRLLTGRVPESALSGDGSRPGSPPRPTSAGPFCPNVPTPPSQGRAFSTTAITRLLRPSAT